MPCPACAATIALAVAGTTTTAGLGALAVVFGRRARHAPPAAATPEPEREMETETARPTVATRAEWLAARRALLAREKEATRLRDAIAAERRELPMVRVERHYEFDGPDGPTTLRDLFGDRRQLVVYHFMFAPSWDEGCRSCSYVMDNVEGALAHLGAADTAFAAVSRAPLPKLEAFRRRMGWRFPWVSSGESEFNYDFHVSFDERRAGAEYNYTPLDELQRRGEVPRAATDMPGFSVFLRDGDDVYHTYSTYQRGVDAVLNTYALLDMTPLGRNESRPMEWVRYHDRYTA